MRLAKWLSYIFHPVFATTAMLAFLVFQKNSYVYYTISSTGRWFFILSSFVLTVLAPVISVGYLYYTKQISSIYLEDRRERIIPMAITGAYTYGLYYLFSTLQLPVIVMATVAVGVLGVLLTLVITLFWKISAHMMALAGISGFILAFSEVVYPLNIFVIVCIFIFTGCIGWARLKLEAHSLTQVLVGWVIGLFVSYFAMLYLATNSLLS